MLILFCVVFVYGGAKFGGRQPAGVRKDASFLAQKKVAVFLYRKARKENFAPIPCKTHI